jgi:thioredoxin-dependent peroxiredoxin
MFRRLPALAVLIAALTAPALASLNAGATAPEFKAQASMGGKVFSFSLADALKSGPVVLYFYPAAFTKGCTLEAHAFAEAIDQFKALHATVIGVSHDDIDTLNKFSVSECRSKFAVAADPTLAVAKQYDAVLPDHPTYANRTSYVIAPNGKILATLTDLEHPEQHVDSALAALKKYEAAQTK